jgi:hypothetical protein
MRLLIVPFILVALLVQTPTTALGNSNQEAAEKIADIIGERFPDADIKVSYKGGKVWLQGEAATPEMQKKIIEQVFNVPGVKVSEVEEEIKLSPRAISVNTVPAKMPTASAVTVAPVPVPAPAPARVTSPVASHTPTNARQAALPPRAQPPQPPQSPQSLIGAVVAPYPHQQYQPAYGMSPQAAPQYVQQQHQPVYYGPPTQAAYHPEAYGPQGPMPGRYNQPNLPDHAWPAYANYPNSAQISYPRMYSPKAWPYIGPYYPYPQVPDGWRKVTLEHHNGWWWLDFDDGTPSGPFSGLFRQPTQYRY